MTREILFMATAAAVVMLGLVGMVATADLVRRVLALNVIGTGIFLIFATVAWRSEPSGPDPVPHALVLTGIVVAVSVTAVALALARRVEDMDMQIKRKADRQESP
jgi:multicomponent Na+:H+ antiporter subunit C